MTTNSTKYPPIPARDLGGKFQINNPDDETPIREMFALQDELILITDKCTYKVQLADQIDPDRKNPALPPNFQQKIFERGIKSELLCRTLLQAKIMFRKEFQSINIEKANHLSLEALGELIAMEEQAQTFKNAERAEIEKAHALKRKDMSLAIPAIGNVRIHCKQFAQKADHFAKSLLEIVRLYYPEMKKKNWDHLQELVKSLYGEDDLFYKTLEITIPILKLVLVTRNCLDHKNMQGVITHDFKLLFDGRIAVPAIEVNRDGTILDCVSISSFMEYITTSMTDAFEMMIVHMSYKNIQTIGGLPITIALLSEEDQKTWHVRFAYGSYYSDEKFVPCS